VIRIFPSSTALSGAVAFCAALAPFNAHACSQWELARETVVGQLNGFNTVFNIEQNFETGELKGSAYYWSYGGGRHNGTFTGNIRGPNFKLGTSWGGIYEGTVTSNGSVEGYTYDRQHNNPVAWVGSKPGSLATCRDAEAQAGQPSAPAPNPLDRFGDVKLPRGGADILTKVTPPPAQPAQPASQSAITKDDVDIYQGPDGSYAVLGWVEATAQAAVLAHQNDWYQLDFNGVAGVHWNTPGLTSGWIAYDHLKVIP
jgi:hypothetical protein